MFTRMGGNRKGSVRFGNGGTRDHVEAGVRTSSPSSPGCLNRRVKEPGLNVGIDSQQARGLYLP